MISISRYKGNGGSAKKRLGLGYKTSLPEDKTIKKLTFPQLSPPMVLQETLDSLALKVPYKQGKDEVAFLHTTKAGTKVKTLQIFVSLICNSVENILKVLQILPKS